MPVKKFQLVHPEGEPDDPIQFALEDRTFTCLSDLPVAATHALVSFASPIRGAIAFIRGALIANDEDAFDEMLARKDVLITEDVLMDVLDYVSGRYTARPTQRPISLPDGGSPTNDGAPASSPFGGDASP